MSIWLAVLLAVGAPADDTFQTGASFVTTCGPMATADLTDPKITDEQASVFGACAAFLTGITAALVEADNYTVKGKPICFHASSPRVLMARVIETSNRNAAAIGSLSAAQLILLAIEQNDKCP